MVFTYAYDVLGRMTSVAVKIGTTDDYVNNCVYSPKMSSIFSAVRTRSAQRRS